MYLRPRLNLGRRKLGGADPIAALGTLGYRYDAKASSITVTGSGVSEWADTSGTTNAPKSLLQGTDANRPPLGTSGGEPAVLFTSNSTWLQSVDFGAVITEFHGTSYAVVEATAPLTTLHYMLQTLLPGEAKALIYNGAAIQCNYNPRTAGSGALVVIGGQSLVRRIFLYRADETGPNCDLLTDTGGTASATFTSTQLENRYRQITMGNRVELDFGFTGYIMETGAFLERFDDTKRTKLMDELKAKWNI